MRFKLLGTTFSGHTIATSFMGTVRNVCYNEFPAWLIMGETPYEQFKRLLR